MPRREDLDPLAPQREAALFYGMFLRGRPVEVLRQEIDIPRELLEKWMKSPKYTREFKESALRTYQYRKRVLAIFDELVHHDLHRNGCKIH